MSRYSLGGVLSITSTPTAVKLEGNKHLCLINDGSDEIYITIEQDLPLGGVVSTSSFFLNAGEAQTWDSETNSKGFLQVNIVCDTGETASVRYSAWQ